MDPGRLGQFGLMSSIHEYRPSLADRQWNLPAWGHPLAQGVLPLFLSAQDRLIPIGTAFTFGGSIGFLTTAMHNFREGWRLEPRLEYLFRASELPCFVDQEEVGFSVLHHTMVGNRMTFTILPLETVDAAPPTDVAIGYPVFSEGLVRVVYRLGFDLPAAFTRVLSLGYTAFKFPDGGIPLADVRAGTFDWQHAYSHRFIAVEGSVQRVFTQRFSVGFVEGPCFTFDANIPHGLSGGPVLSENGVVLGVNAAGADSFFSKPMSIASLLYPLLLMDLRFGASIGPMRLNATRSLFHLIGQGAVPTDGSEAHVAFAPGQASGRIGAHPRAPQLASSFVHDDFGSFQARRPATRFEVPSTPLKP